MNGSQSVFDAETWALLPGYFEEIPHKVRLKLWSEAAQSLGEREALRMARTLADAFEQIETVSLHRLQSYPYYPIIGVMGLDDSEEIDFGVRIIGLPAGTQLTSLITAIQAVSFRGVTLEPATRLRLRTLQTPVQVELLTTADDDAGPQVAKHAFGLAVASPHIRAMLIMADAFPEASIRYSAGVYPHTVINGVHHVAGILTEEELLQQIALAVGQR